MRLQDALDAFLLQLAADGRSTHTIRQYQRHVRQFAAFVGADRDLATITVGDVARFLTAPPTTEGRAPATLNALRTSLRVCFKHLHEAAIAPTNPARMLRLARCSPPPPRGLSDEEVRRLTDALVLGEGPNARRDHMLIDVMLLAGLRLGSALALDREDVDLESRELHLRVTKGQAPERVPVGRELLDHLVAYLADRPAGPLFTTQAGVRLGQRQAQRRIEHWLARSGAGKGASAHSMRHAFALRLYRRTRDIGLVQRALRHRSIASTLAYAHASDEDVRAAL